MSSSNIRIYQVTSRENPAQLLELRGLATGESEFVVASTSTSKEWNEGNFGETDPRTTFPPLAERPFSEKKILDHFQSLLANTVNIFDGVKGAFLNVAIELITLVTIAPSVISKSQGTTHQFSSSITPAESTQDVVWTIDVAAGLTINQTGLVTIGAGVALANYNVTATSVADGTKLGVAVLTVTV